MCEPGLIRPGFLFEDRNAKVILCGKANAVTYIFQIRLILILNERSIHGADGKMARQKRTDDVSISNTCD